MKISDISILLPVGATTSANQATFIQNNITDILNIYKGSFLLEDYILIYNCYYTHELNLRYNYILENIDV